MVSKRLLQQRSVDSESIVLKLFPSLTGSQCNSSPRTVYMESNLPLRTSNCSTLLLSEVYCSNTEQNSDAVVKATRDESA